MKYCSKHHSNPDEAIYCNECGERLISILTQKKNICPKCKAENPKDADFCHTCGWKLSETFTKPKPSIKPMESNETNIFQHIISSIAMNYKISEIYLGKICMWTCSIISVISLFVFIRCCINGSALGFIHLAIIVSYIGICYQKLFWAKVWLIALFILIIEFIYILSIVDFDLFGVIMDNYPLAGIIMLLDFIGFAIVGYNIYNKKNYFR